MAFNLRVLIAVALPPLLAAYQEEVHVRISQDAQSATFTAEPFTESFDPCIDRVSVYAQEAGGEQRIWYASQGLGERRCVTSVRYGVQPPNFSAESAPPLRKGTSYRVALVGPGFSASETFERR